MTEHNESIVKKLLTIAENGTAANAYLISGGDREARKTIAEKFAAALTDSPADILHPAHEKPDLFSVEDVRREINETVAIRPYGQKKKVYIVVDADLMNVQAENALLKTLEEPPAYVVILLLTESLSVFLPTVLSRSVKVTLSETGGQGAAGAPQELIALLNKCDKMTNGDLIALSKRYGSKKKAEENAETPEFIASIEAVRKRFRDVLVKKGGGNVTSSPDDGAAIEKAAETLSFEAVGRILNGVETADERRIRNADPAAVMESLLRLIRNEYQEAL